MNAAVEVLDRLTSLGASVRLEGDRVIVRAGAVGVPAEVMAAARAQKAALLGLLSAIPAEWIDGIARLDPDAPPLDFPSVRWARLVADARHFLERLLASEAARLGWGTLDLFGADRVRPFARIDRMGLLPILNGDRLAELRRDHAVIITRTGARQSFHRRPVDSAHVVPVWELAS